MTLDGLPDQHDGYSNQQVAGPFYNRHRKSEFRPDPEQGRKNRVSGLLCAQCMSDENGRAANRAHQAFEREDGFEIDAHADQSKGDPGADGGLEAWTRFLLKAVREGGSITMIHRADRLADVLALLSVGAGSFRIRPIHPFAAEPAKRVLVRAIKTGKAPLVLLPPLVLHDREGGKHTAEVEAILRGEAGLGWD